MIRNLELSSLEQIGQKLKSARESRGLSLGQIYDRTKIPTTNLEAIESGDNEQLPEPVYVAGFIKRYADCVGLNGQGLAEEYKVYVEQASDNGKGVFPSWGSKSANKTRSVALQSAPVVHAHASKVTIEPPRPGLLKSVFWPSVLIVLVLVCMGYVVMYQNQIYMNSNHDTGLQGLRDSTSRFAGVEPTTPPTPTGTTTPSQVATTPSPAAATDCRVTLQASQHVWVEVKSLTTGDSIFTGFLEAGDRRDFVDKQGLKVSAGNGGSLNVSYNGKHETFGAPGKRASKSYSVASAATPGSDGQSVTAAPAGAVIEGASTSATATPPAVKKWKPPAAVKKAPPKPATSGYAAPTRYIPGDSGGGRRSIEVPYRYTDGRLDSD